MVDVRVDPDGIGSVGDLVAGWASIPRAGMSTAAGCLADDVVAASVELAASVAAMTAAFAAGAGELGSGANRIAEVYECLEAAGATTLTVAGPGQTLVDGALVREAH